jgi:large subunit ribosomal protein L29
MKDSYKELTADELAVKREELRKQYNDVRFNAVIGHVDNPLGERVLRRKLARVYTLINEFHKGIRTKADVQASKASAEKRAATAEKRAASAPPAAAPGAAESKE